ncbi:hypothetical protein BDY21DRAFT_307362 [Lineolata rhizophorae]|uniref:PCI domain-containing protein n=1 Tax=Lineolata rhizophorae TaxID=578093 RepID=A0A6A6NUU7_9PEZI|nr:hypothetical protein BDY21DRAFT_307362 [Lineolata rhizophorae]
MSPTPTLDQFLGEIAAIVSRRDGAQLQDYLIIEPPYGALYNQMITELHQEYPLGKEAFLEDKCAFILAEAQEGADGATWTMFIKFMVQYLTFLRDVNVENLLDTYNLLSELVQKCISALAHPTLGIVVLPTVIAYSRVLARLAIGLDRQPHLIAHLVQRSAGGEEGGAETLPERAANIVRTAFVTCLNDRTANPSGLRDGKPDGKKAGIYTLANLCLKILFQCKKTRNVEQIFSNIYNQSPLLSAYPKPEQATYLYYLGRFMYQNNHFRRSAAALQHAFDLTPPRFVSQRHSMLVYLISANLPLGRFPSENLYNLPEAAGLRELFFPVTRAIVRGDLASFRKLLDLNLLATPSSENTSNLQLVKENHERVQFLFRRRVLLQLRNRCEVLVLRSLARRTYVVAGQEGNVEKRKAATLDLQYYLQALRWLEMKALMPNWVPAGLIENGPSFAAENVQEESDYPLPDIFEAEAVISALIDQGLLNGFISRNLRRFAIVGSKRKGNPLAAGFPPPASILAPAGFDEREEVPGWRREGLLGSHVGFGAPTGSQGMGMGRGAGTNFFS